jgi:DNA gyrase subunit A
MSRTARGKSAVNILDLDSDEEIEAVVNTDDLTGEDYLTMVTRGGYIKRTAGDEFENILSTGIRAIKLEEGDALADVEVTDGSQDVVISTAGGMAIRFDESEARAMGRATRGVRGIRLEGDDRVAGVAAIDADSAEWLLTVTENGFGKRTDIDDYRVQSRNGKGLIDIKTEERNGGVCAIDAVSADDELFAMSEDGQIMRTPVDGVSVIGRNTMGVRVMDLDTGDHVATVDVFRGPDGEE